MRKSLTLAGVIGAALSVTLFNPHSAFATDATWNKNTSANWNVAGNWTPNVIPNAAGDLANVTNNITSAWTVWIRTAPVTVGVINIGDATGTSAFTVSTDDGSKLIFDNNGSAAQINKSQGGSDVFGSALSILLNDSLNINQNTSVSAAITIKGSIASNNADANTITNQGAGTTGLTIEGVVSDGIAGGKIELVQNSSTSPMVVNGAASNTYTGGTKLMAGRLGVGSSAANQLGTGTFTISGGTLTGAGTTAPTIANSVVIAGDFTLGTGTSFGAVTLSGPIDLGTALRTITATNAQHVFSGDVSGVGGGINKAGANPLTLSGANTYTGDTEISQGVLKLAATGDIDVNSLIKVASKTTSTAKYTVSLDGSQQFQDHDVRSQLTGAGNTFWGNDSENLGAGLGSSVLPTTQDVSMEWKLAANTDVGGLAASNVLTLTMPSDLSAGYVLGMMYDELAPSIIAGGEASANIARSLDGGTTWAFGGTNPDTYAGLDTPGDYYVDEAGGGAYPGSPANTVYVVFSQASGGGDFVVVPEPGMLALLATGLLGLIAYAWRKRK